MHSLLRIWVFVLDLFFPRKCVGCGVEGRWICGVCVKTEAQKFLFEPVSPGIFGLFRMEERCIKEAVHILKYNFVHEAAGELVDLLASSCSREDFLRALGLEGDVRIIPIPISRARLKERGYNQAELLAKALGSWLDFPVELALLKRLKGKTLVGKNRQQRQLQTFHAFNLLDGAEVSPDLNYLLVDDVITTGSTLKVCRYLLCEAGARHVVGVAFACRHLDGE